MQLDTAFARFGQLVYFDTTDKAYEYMRDYKQSIEEFTQELIELACSTEITVATKNTNLDKLLDFDEED